MSVPLYVDVDGTLLNTDLLLESAAALIKKNVVYLLLMPFWLVRGKANLKHQIAQRTELRCELLPINKPFLEYLKQQKESGRELILASASHKKFVAQLADHLGIFDGHIASDADTNCRSKVKLAAIQQHSGEQGFAYAGNSRADLIIWRHTQEAVLVNCTAALQREAERHSNVGPTFTSAANFWPKLISAMRAHQWIKNLLLFLPLLLSHQLGNSGLALQAFVAFLSFSLCASGVYLINDLLDLENDRQHVSKHSRPFAAGDLSLLTGFLAAPLLLLAALAISTLLPLAFFYTLLLYFFITQLYNFTLKRLVIIDVLTLAGLYTLRIIAGAAAVSVVPTFWLLAFSMFLFLSLAIVKRYTELSNLKKIGKEFPQGRGYVASDLSLLAVFGPTCGYLAVLVFALYINAQETQLLYSSLTYLWLICPLLLYFVSRFWLLAHRGQLDEDPVVFTSTDRHSQIVIVLCVTLIWLAI